MEKKIQLGILLNSDTIPYWVWEMLRAIKDSEYAEVNLLIYKMPEVQKQSGVKRYFKILKNLPFILLYKIDKILYRVKNDPFAHRSIKSLFPEASNINVKTVGGKFTDRFPDEDIETIRGYNLDVIFRVGFRILKGDILNVARYGVWSYHHGDNKINRGMPATFWEFVNKEIVTGTILQVLSEELDNGKIIYKKFARTHPNSVSTSMYNTYWGSMNMFPRALKYLYYNGEESFYQLVNKNNKSIDFYSSGLYKMPRFYKSLGLLLTAIIRFFRVKIRARFKTSKWNLLYKFTDSFNGELRRYNVFNPPKNKFWADPFVINDGENHYIFFEEQETNKKKAHISLVTINRQTKTFSGIERVLDRPYHLSYPFVFKSEGQYYMVPETKQNKTIELYQATQFPLKWELKVTLLKNINAVDSTLFYYDNKWWLFCGVTESDLIQNTDELHIFYATSLESKEWTPHRANPVIADCRYARPAGRIFERDGKIYRPSQDCSINYGYAINFNRIIRLTTDEYEEVPEDKIYPRWHNNMIGTHTFNFEEGIQVLDSCRLVSKF
ncbi:MAG TPA: hypothetical protein VEC12_02325 [Bacteroidia bacterium]|nr:hypothetical protein [Bacteroidia bacterium]